MPQGSNDSRFAGLQKDPRFRRPASKKSKTVLDSRFEKVLTDDRFRGSSDVNPRGYSKSSTRSGGKRDSRAVNEDMKKFYELADDVQIEGKDAEDSDANVSASEKEGFHWDAASTSSDEEDEKIVMEVDAELQEEEDVPLGESTDRIGIMNCNWDHVTATDLFVLIQTFLDDNAPGRKLKKIAVHKSDFGAERMEREEMYGPIIEGMPEDDDAEDSLKTKQELKAAESQRCAAIRKYEELKKKYFFAIAEFDSINTACIVYDELDGVSSGFVSEALDLRFIPDDVQDPSNKREPLSQTTKVPAGYAPPNVEVGALTMQHSKVTCSWDDDTPERKILMKKLTPAQIADLDLAAYLESSSDEDQVDAASLRKALLGEVGSESGESEPAPEGDMEMSFSRGVESVGQDVAKRMAETGKTGKQDLSQWELYLQKKKEAKRVKKTERRDQIETQRQERITKAKETSKAAKRLAREADEGNSSNDDHLPFVNKSLLSSDARLERMAKNPQFAVDPTHPNFKKLKDSPKRR